MLEDYTPHQQKIIKRYYRNEDILLRQRLAEMVSDLYLSEGKKRKQIWKRAAQALSKLGVSPSRIQHLLKQEDPALLAEVVKELQSPGK